MKILRPEICNSGEIGHLPEERAQHQLVDHQTSFGPEENINIGGEQS